MDQPTLQSGFLYAIFGDSSAKKEDTKKHQKSPTLGV
jgi:hypothetical protein